MLWRKECKQKVVGWEGERERERQIDRQTDRKEH